MSTDASVTVVETGWAIRWEDPYLKERRTEFYATARDAYHRRGELGDGYVSRALMVREVSPVSHDLGSLPSDGDSKQITYSLFFEDPTNA